MYENVFEEKKNEEHFVGEVFMATFQKFGIQYA